MSANSDPCEFHQKKKKKSECIIFERKAEKGPLAAFCVSNCYETRNKKKKKITAWLLFTIIVMYNLEIWRARSVRFIHV